MRDFRKYDIWIDSVALVNKVYDLMDQFPNTEKYGLRSQMGRSVISIPSNIAEGAGRKSAKEFSRFLEIALSSAYELETQILISKNRGFITIANYDGVLMELQSIQKRISGLIHSL